MGMAMQFVKNNKKHFNKKCKDVKTLKHVNKVGMVLAM